MPEGYRRLPKVVNQAGDGYRRFDCGVSEIEQGEVREAHGVQTLGGIVPRIVEIEVALKFHLSRL